MDLGEHYDVIVVGTGPGGSTVAKELALKGLTVLILEWGKTLPIKGTFRQMAQMGAVPGTSLRLTSGMVPVIRGVTLGGSSALCYATAFDPPPSLFDAYGVDLSTELAEAHNELTIGHLKDELIGPMARRIMRAAQAGGYNWQKLDKIIQQANCRAGCWRCTYGCPYDAKWSAGQFVKQAVDHGARLITEAKVQKVLKKDSRAKGVEFIHRGNVYQAFADKIVISAGGLGSPVILKQSGIASVGNGLFLDPAIAVMGKVGAVEIRPGERPGCEVPMAAGMLCEQEGYMLADMALPPALFRVFTMMAGRLDNLLCHNSTAILMVKVRDSLSGSIGLRGQISKGLSVDDKSKLREGYECARAVLALCGAKKIYKSGYFAAHPGGTVKLGQCVDSNLEAEVSGLHVCDASVIPKEWGLPPVLTLICLGKRLARHLLI
ncbi:GMC family oxidoreductase N-terminal domain-containing protein [Endozoicomonas sp. Mp262]|uniref:GMC family oxidoreductase N-terminal domain-containing protein n=1 Tax=Endozoicomonas sp. Mp262 TaxID=2919499 RepID=UPI0021D935FB